MIKIDFILHQHMYECGEVPTRRIRAPVVCTRGLSAQFCYLTRDLLSESWTQRSSEAARPLKSLTVATCSYTGLIQSYNLYFRTPETVWGTGEADRLCPSSFEWTMEFATAKGRASRMFFRTISRPRTDAVEEG